ncbi:MAG: MmcQ/YjbR family DNA-binding protein [Planctomycetes bacterium]|nr:MmcQ/YjbR family DNA-binding protein [Planctomycetota bacterium]
MTPAAAYRATLAYALRFPETCEESPWGERVVKVRKKVFVFLGKGQGGFSVTTKLPLTGGMALQLPFAAPCGYGLGKSGWVTARFAKGEDVPLELVRDWVDESFRAVAPKTLVKQLAVAGGGPAEVRPVARPRARRKEQVLVLTGDPLRGERAARGYAEQGLRCDVAELDAPSARRKLALAVVDLGRRPGEALEVAEALLQRRAGPRVLVCGIRDARMEKRAQAALGDVPRSRHAPGHPRAIELGVGLLREDPAALEGGSSGQGRKRR